MKPFVDPGDYWLDPKEHTPPLGSKIFILTRLFVAIVGRWDADAQNKGWRPLFKIPAGMR